MADRPILFSAPMVRALLAGTKTQTRRIIKPQPVPAAEASGGTIYGHLYANDWIWPTDGGYIVSNKPGGPDRYAERLANKRGDRLWVKENGWQRPERTAQMMRDGADTWAPYFFDADLDAQDHADFKAWGFKRRPSIHMPRVHSRLTLHVTDVRVERLNDISPDDAAEEGAVCDMSARTFVDHYRNIWERINGAGSWAKNPWVAAYTFTVERANIDQTRLAA
jgi:hypothetical protein